jgi:hypothetical protein
VETIGIEKYFGNCYRGELVHCRGDNNIRHKRETGDDYHKKDTTTKNRREFREMG